MKVYQQKISELDGELKLSGVKIKNMEYEIGSLNKKIKNIAFKLRSSLLFLLSC